MADRSPPVTRTLARYGLLLTGTGSSYSASATVTPSSASMVSITLSM